MLTVLILLPIKEKRISLSTLAILFLAWSHSFNHQPFNPGWAPTFFRVVGLLLRQSETAADKTRATIANGSLIRNFIYPGVPSLA